MSDESTIRAEICEIGKRVYAKGFSSANDGNISCRLSDGRVLCTPTLICKGFMKPEDLCIVDLDGVQSAGHRKRTSEILLHLEIYKNDTKAMAVVHCHPPHVLAFAMTGAEIPTGLLPEVEIFLGNIPRVEYETPGTQKFAETIKPFVAKANTAVLANHGSVSWANSLERAYWYTEILDAYCKSLILAKQLGEPQKLPPDKIAELQQLRQRFC